MTSAPAGWYLQDDGRMRYWDGTAWTEHVAAGAGQAGPPMRGPVTQTLRSLVSAPVAHDPDAVWQAVGKPLTGVGGGRYKLTRHFLFVERGVLSTDSQQVPIAHVVDVDLRQSLVQKSRNVGSVAVHVQGARGPETVVLEDIAEFREAQRIINQLANEARLALQRNANTHRYEAIHTASATPHARPAPSAAPADSEALMVQLRQLGELRDAGVLTEEEFTAKKADILSRL